MVFVTEITNVFDPIHNKKTTLHTEGQPLKAYLPIIYSEVIVSYNGEITSDYDQIVKEDSQIIIAPVLQGGGGGGKNILRAVAFVALVVAAPYLAQQFMGATAGLVPAGAYGSAFAYAAVQAAVVAAGSMLINAVMPIQMPDINIGDGLKSSPTYGWSNAKTTPNPGAPLPVLYGQYRLPGNIIGQYIIDEGDDQYLYMLLALCEGEVEDISLTDILINNNPVDNFEGVLYDYRVGTADQLRQTDLELKALVESPKATKFIPWFSEVRIANVFSAELVYNTPTERTTSSNSVEGVEVEIVLPNGLFKLNDDGSFGSNIVDFKIEYKKHDDTEWTVFPRATLESEVTQYEWNVGMNDDSYVWYNDGESPDWGFKTGRSRKVTTEVTILDYWSIEAATKKTIRRHYTIGPVEEAQYDIRVTKLTEDPASNKEVNALYWGGFNEINYTKLYYPHTALLALKVKATGQLSGSAPTISTLTRRTTIEVFDETGTSQGFKRSNNPAWIAWDILTNKRYGLGKDYSRVDFAAFSDFADWCDEDIDPSEDGKEYRASFDGVIDFQTDLWSALQKVCSVGRASPIIIGTSYSVKVDKPEDPVQLFTMGNIVKGSYKTSYIGVQDLANEIEITYYDQEANYTKQVLSVVTGDGGKKTSVHSLGTTTQSQAYRLGNYMLQCNDKQRRIVEFDAGIDSIACTIGDIILFAHDVPQWGESGRLVSATTNTVTLDRKVYCTVGTTYRVTIRLKDDTFIIRDIQNVEADGEYDTFTVAADFDVVPEQFDVYTLGEIDKEYLKLRVTGITRKNDQTRHISCLDYNESILIEGVTPEPVSRPAPVQGFPQLVDVQITEHLEKRGDGTIVPFIDFQWRVKDSQIAEVDILMSNDTGNSWNPVVQSLKEPFYTYQALSLAEGVTYRFALVTADVTGRQPIADSTQIDHTYLGKSEPPDITHSITLTELPAQGIQLEWLAVPEVDVAGYNIYRNGKRIAYMVSSTSYRDILTQKVDTGYYVTRRDTTTNTTTTEYRDYSPLGPDLLYEIETVDTSGNVSLTKASIEEHITPPTVEEATIAYVHGKVQINVTDVHYGAFVVDFYIYRDDTTSKTYQSSEMTMLLDSHGAGSYTYSVQAVDIAGNTSDWYTVTASVTAPTVSHAYVSYPNDGVTITVDDVAEGTYPIVFYYFVNTDTGDVVYTTDSFYKFTDIPAGTTEYAVFVKDSGHNFSNQYPVVVTIVPPSIPSVSISYPNGKVELKVDDVVQGTYQIGFYEYMALGADNPNPVPSEKMSYIFDHHGEGSTTYQVRVWDIRGYHSDWMAATATISKPVVLDASVSYPNGQIKVEVGHVSIAEYPIATYKFKNDTTGEVVETEELSYTYPQPGVGTFKYFIQAIDVGGIQSDWFEASATVQAPELVEATAVCTEGKVRITVGLTKEHTNKIVSYNFKDNTSSSVISTEKTIYEFPDHGVGTYSYQVQAVDIAGINSAWYVVSVTVIAPVVSEATLTYPNGKVELSVNKTAEGTYPIVSYNYKDETTSVEAASQRKSYTFPSHGAGNYNYSVQAVDISGNTSAWLSVSTAVVKPSVANVSLLYPEDKVKVIVSDVTQGTYSVASYNYRDDTDGTLVASPRLSHEFPSHGAGAYNYSVQAVDITGITSDWASATTGVERPVVTRVDVAYVSGRIQLTVSGVTRKTYAVTGYRYKDPNGANVVEEESKESVFSFPNHGAGTYSYYVQAVDINGNLSDWFEAPVTVITPSISSAAAEFVDGKVKVTITEKSSGNYPITSYRYVDANGDTTINSTSKEETFVFPNHGAGTYSYSLYAIDAGGIESPAFTQTVTLGKPSINSVGVLYPQGKVRISVASKTEGEYPIVSYNYRDDASGAITVSKELYLEVPQKKIGGSTSPYPRTYSVQAVDEGGILSDWTSATANVVPPGSPEVVTSIEGSFLVLDVTCDKGTNLLDLIEVVYNNEVITAAASPIRITPTSYENLSVEVTCIDVEGNRGGTTTVDFSATAPNVINLTFVFIDDKVKLTWDVENDSFPIDYFKVTDGNTVFDIRSNSYITNADWTAAKTFTVQAVDIHNNSGFSQSISVHIDTPQPPLVDGKVHGTDLQLTWNKPEAALGISHYVVEYDSVAHTVDALTYSLPVTWAYKVFTVYAIDVAGNEGEATEFTHTVKPPEVQGASYQVIDNNVILKWRYVEGDLPLDTVIVKRGEEEDNAEVIGTKKGTFTVVFESEAGVYTYWLCPRDTAGNMGLCSKVTANVGAPPDYKLNAVWESDLTGTKVNSYLDPKKQTLYLPINLTETYQEHFDNHSWSTPQDQMSAGYPVWTQPYPATASYEEVFDYGVTLASSTITLSWTQVDSVGSTLSFTANISVSLDGTDWIDYTDVTYVYATNFRYVKVKLICNSPDDKSMAGIQQLAVRLDSKVIRDSGFASADAGDANGTFVPFNIHFVDVSSIIVTPQGTSTLTAVYDFDDVPNPTGFSVYLFDNNGNRTSGNVSWQATGY